MLQNYSQSGINKHEHTLDAFSRALNREGHVLTQHPDLLWQQMYNRLQWEGEEEGYKLAPELIHHCASSF